MKLAGIELAPAESTPWREAWRAPGRLVLDLNFAYNPSCVYNPAWACPLAPAGNRLPAEVPVGELLPAGYDG